MFATANSCFSNQEFSKIGNKVFIPPGVKTRANFSCRRKWKCCRRVYCPATMRSRSATLSTPSRGIHAQKICWITAPCLVSTHGYPGERSAVGPFCLSQYPRQAEVRVTAGSNAGAMPNQRNTWGRYRATNHDLPKINLAERC